MSYQAIQVRFQESVCFITFDRPEAQNTINECMIRECLQVLESCEEAITVVVLEGLPQFFCLGADFQEIYNTMGEGQQDEQNPEPLYELWLKLATGPYITISHVRGRVNAGGIGFVAASDIVLADNTAQFSLSELLFGLYPACVLPFLIRRTGFQKANYLTLMTRPITVQQAYSWGIVDAYDTQSDSLLRKHLLRLKCLSKEGVLRYKRYVNELDDSLIKSKLLAVTANKEMFSDPQNLKAISQYVEKGVLPWEH